MLLYAAGDEWGRDIASILTLESYRENEVQGISFSMPPLQLVVIGPEACVCLLGLTSDIP